MEPFYAYNTSSRARVPAIPDFSFYEWKEAKLPNLFEFRINGATEFSTKKDKLFWMGSDTHPDRPLVVDKCKGPDFDVEFMTWDKETGLVPTRHVPIEEFRDYKYLLDIRGRGWSARLKFLLLTGSVVFICERSDVEYWHDQFRPWIHYVPVKSDGSNLVENLEKLKADQVLAKKIAEAGLSKAREVFHPDSVRQALKSVLSTTGQAQ